MQALLRIEREHVQQLQHQLLEAEATARLPEAREVSFGDGFRGNYHQWRQEFHG